MHVIRTRAQWLGTCDGHAMNPLNKDARVKNVCVVKTQRIDAPNANKH